MKTYLKILIFGFLILNFGLKLPWVLAQEEASPSQALKEKIKERLEKTATNSSQMTNESNQVNRYYAWVGTLKEVNQNKLIILTDQGEKEALLSEKTTILQSEKGKSRREIKAKELKLENFIIAMGQKNNDNSLTALRVISSPKEILPEKKVIFGKVLEVDEDKIKTENQEILPIDQKTNIKINGNKEAKISDIQLEDKIFAVVILKDKKISQTKTIFVLPGKNNPQTSINPALEKPATATASNTNLKTPFPSATE